MSKIKFPVPLRLPPSLDKRVLQREDLPDGEGLNGFEAEGLDAAELVRDQLKFDQVVLHRASFVGSQFSRAQLWDVRLRACDLASAQWLTGDWARVEFDECRLTGFQGGQSTFKNVAFRSCKLELTNFRLAEFTSCLFENCSLKDADFQGCKMSKIRFEGCDLTGARFDRSELSEVDLRSSNLVELGSVEGLSGALIDSGQALELASRLATALGLVVKDQGRDL